MMSSSSNSPSPDSSSFGPEIHANNLRLGSILAASAIIITLGILVLFPYFQREALVATEMPPTVALGREIPEFLTPGKAFRAPEGKIVEVFDRAENIKVSVVISPKRATVSNSGSLIEAILDFAANKPSKGILSIFHLKFLSTQFDLKKIFDVTSGFIMIGDESVPTESFASKHDEFFQVGKFEKQNGEISFLAVTINHRVPSEALSKILTAILATPEKIQ